MGVIDPIAKDPTVSKAPPTGRKFPCANCGARLDFDPKVRGLKCPYCGFEEKIEKADHAEVHERDYLEYLSREEGKGKALPGRSTETRCTGCGAVVLLEDKVATDKCPFCATHLETAPEAAKAMIPPEAVLPFKEDLKGAREAFDRWLTGLWFAPNELKGLANLGQLSGVYVPYWTYDAMTYTFYDGERGDNYTVTIMVTERDSEGRERQVPQTVIQVRWTNVSGEVQHFFDDVLVCGSKSLRDDLVDKIGPWELPKLEPFEPAYLSGFKTERYAIGLKEGMQAAKKEMEQTIYQLICQDIGGDQQRVYQKQTRYSGMTFKHTLLPVWVAAYRYNNKAYQILVNGRSGKVAGDRPYSTWKIARLVILILLAILIVGVIALQLGKGKSTPRTNTDKRRADATELLAPEGRQLLAQGASPGNMSLQPQSGQPRRGESAYRPSGALPNGWGAIEPRAHALG
jgi:DNA-directed RNA polymerase subunit RPC12/RpoP